ncbi:MAG: hypothetical protein KatS3mg068_0531 [Candidatus Sericytochromatia bacterium]|nr:MAG: hypothetical protein KatS3mg068_0531 [Candidatus Sericytochromatia bacterium]
MKNCILLIGDDEYSKEEFIKDLINSKIDLNWKEFNLFIFNLDDTKTDEINKVIEACSSPPLGFGSKIVVVKKNNLPESQELISLLKKGLISEVYLILSCISLDERKNITKTLVSFFDKKIFNIPKSWELTKKLTPWLEDYIRKYNKKIEKNAAEELVVATNGDKRRIINEVEKLLLYSNEKNIITYDDVKLLVKNTESNIFNLIDFLSKKDIHSALIEISNLLLHEEGIVILASLQSNLRYIYNLKVLYEDKMTFKEISDKLKKHTYIIEKDFKAWKNYPIEKLRELLNDLVKIELKFKSTKVEPRLEFEKFIISWFS